MTTPPPNALMALFLEAWTHDGLADTVAAAPHAALAARGLAVADDVAVTAFGWRGETEHLCRSCQLAVPGVYATLGPGRARTPRSALDALFARADERAFVEYAVARPREALAELGLAVTANVRVVIRADAGPAALELQLCAAFHACLCETPALEPIVFARWPG